MTASLQLQVFETIDAYRRWRSSLLDDGSGRPLVGFVPTMGALHRGHATLMREARLRCQHVVVSVFVNPLQFGPNEDYDRYPRALENDLQICRSEQVDAVFHPSVPEMYPAGQDETTRVFPPRQLTERLCGTFRPGHFEGVATVVLKLFGIIEPTCAFFGEKDYQQLTIIKRMVADLNFPTQVVGVPTVRESDGLALSSRNAYLQAEERPLAARLHMALRAVCDQSLSGRKPLTTAVAEQIEALQAAGLAVQYLQACDPDSLEPLQQARRPMVVLVAAKLGSVRLIDNILC